MTVVITRDVESRYRGFIASVMVEVASGVYIAPLLNSGVRDRVWEIVSSWYDELQSGSITMVWKDSSRKQGLGLKQLGVPPKDIYDHEGFLLVRKKSND
ncbi:MAG: type I-E CRISPR-associated endoribonuclease Cas2 [Rhodothermaceae bacterium]|nr:type I-E CRISPR-associated endoribonuclease Cas2 [Rhodothermaceae bacterium]MXW31799.1 type I-E CRISPR-associated endoribonuclease Cas2 [Rhodothermaceae bacterium]MYC05050.1 type I-E CRISPR-associated endoribonuclease Cas2 [Rhodothermaceae bacterium]MYE62977.1 type I-E CRISPR-associated endoribonuclease Cas2 [Rhodothermaceae bacterium]MYI16374.1 type I-E CRISPR-associated endoribonuclease Cas2 [Rhodothermaceae bacterium]